MKAKVNGIEMYFEIHGEGKPIVLLHGLALDSSIWKEVISLYGNQAMFITPDLRGHGNSEPVMMAGLSNLRMTFWP